MSAAHVYELPDQAERRGEPRRWRLQSGRLAGAAGQSIDCTIMDISTTGARVRVAEGQHLPARIYLVDAIEGVAYKAQLVRSSGREHGLAFTEKFPLADPAKLVTTISFGSK